MRELDLSVEKKVQRISFGIPDIEARLPGRGHLHEAIEGGPAGEFAAIATLFSAGIAAHLANRDFSFFSLFGPRRGKQWCSDFNCWTRTSTANARLGQGRHVHHL